MSQASKQLNPTCPTMHLNVRPSRVSSFTLAVNVTAETFRLREDILQLSSQAGLTPRRPLPWQRRHFNNVSTKTSPSSEHNVCLHARAHGQKPETKASRLFDASMQMTAGTPQDDYSHSSTMIQHSFITGLMCLLSSESSRCVTR